MDRSKAQAAFMHSALSRGELRPSVTSHLPSHVQKLSSGGLACMSCGGEVDEDGNSPEYQDDEDDSESDSERAAEATGDVSLFSAALRGR